MSNTWMAVSEAEYNMGVQIAEDICEKNATLEECLKAMQQVPYIYSKEVEWNKAFNENTEFVSNNLITQIAYVISNKKLLTDGNGVVLTSNILAEDMVRMSLIEWLCANSEFRYEEIFAFVYNQQLSEGKKTKMRLMCSTLSWYDPCVGGGVYPLAILTILQQLKISDMPQIYGYDINPLFVEATIMRLFLCLGKDSEDLIRERIKCGDALDNNVSQVGLFDYFNKTHKYDIVIGNPPYINAGKIERSYKRKYTANYPELEGRSVDLYTYFICHGLNALKNTGVLCFVTPAQFQMSNYGKPIRKVISEVGELSAIADFNELPVFKSIGVHASVYAIIKEKKDRTFRRFEYDQLPESYPLKELYEKGTELPQKNVSEAGWVFSSSHAYSVLDILENKGKPLIEYAGGVYSGIKSSCKRAFFLKTKDLLDFQDYDKERCVKMIIPKKIRCWKSVWDNDYLALIKKDENLAEESMLYKHMLKFKDVLESRTDIAGHGTWYGLRQCGYYEKFSEPKIIYPDISTECRFSMDKGGLFIPDGAFFIPGEDYYLLGILNSCIGRYYFRQKCARIGNPQKGGRIRFKKVYVENFPVVNPSIHTEVANSISKIAMNAAEDGMISEEQQKRLDEFSMEMYEIPSQLKRIIQEI